MTVEAILIAAALSQGVPTSLLSAVCYVESKHNLKALVMEDGGSPSYGLCQIKMGTARGLGYKGSASGLMDGPTNAHYAAKLLRYHYKRYGSWSSAVSAYNAGKCRQGNANYVDKVMGKAYGKKAKYSCSSVLRKTVALD